MGETPAGDVSGKREGANYTGPAVASRTVLVRR
jgi:hypothetical protein